MNEKIDFLKNVRTYIEKKEEENLVEKSRKLFLEQAPLYKSNFASRFILVKDTQIEEVLQEDHFFVSRKIDGEMRTVFFDGEKSVMNSTGGKCEEGFPCLKELSEKLKSKGIKTAAFGAELNFLKEDNSRSRVTDVIMAIADEKLHEKLCLSPYDIIFINGKMWNERNYGKTHERLRELFDGGKLVKPVELQEAGSALEVKRIFHKWVNEEHAEGLVVHPESNVIYKIKPDHTVDAVVAGFTTRNERGIMEVRDLLFSVMEMDGKFRIFGSSGNGLTENQRKELLTRLHSLKAESDYIYTDSRGIAFTMVKPEIIFETSAVDFSNQSSKGHPNKNDMLSFENGKWKFDSRRNGVSSYSLSIVRERKDKSVNYIDLREKQISDICPFMKDEMENEKINLEKSVLLLRRVYKKETKNTIYVKKFYLWKTNKEKSGFFPAFVMQFSYFSSRAKKLDKKVLVSSSLEELKEKTEELISKEIKKGWEYVRKEAEK